MLFLVLSLFIFKLTGAVDLTVDTKVGQIHGLHAEDGDYTMFLGIPYGEVDEKNPFGLSTPHPKFEEPFDAYDDTVSCPQSLQMNMTKETVDCLHLHVYVPDTATPTNRLPVMVWIHGGGFTTGSGGRLIYGPRFIVRYGVILVTLNYRLGPYGFMCLDTPTVPGNQGLKDQLLALRWIKENIEAFGGDANKITGFGESGGAMSLDFHMHSNHETLFNQVILQSGVTLYPTLTSINPGVRGALQLAEHLGLMTSDVDEAISFLATIDTKVVFGASEELDLTFFVCVEKDFDNVEKMVTDYPINLPVPNVKDIPMLIGFTDDEGLRFFPFFEDLNAVDYFVNITFNFDSNFDEMSGLVRHFYLGDEEESLETIRPLIDLDSDISFVHPARRSIKKYFENGAETIYSYVFSYDGTRNFFKFSSNITFGGAAHGDDISYVFDVSWFKEIMSPEDQVTVDRITTLWTNFAKYGDPTPETTDLLPVKWIPTTKDRWNYLDIDSEVNMKMSPFNQRMAFWDLFYKMNQKYEVGYREPSTGSSSSIQVLALNYVMIFYCFYLVCSINFLHIKV